MGKIVHIDLPNKRIWKEENKFDDYGRPLVTRLIHEDNIVLCPGLLSGTLAPSTGRLILGAKKINSNDISFSNIGGTISQKLASLNIDALVISGRNLNEIPAAIIIEDDEIRLKYMEELIQRKVTQTIDTIYNKYGSECGIVGIGPSGENMLPVATLFTTYPKGNPSFYCVRNSIGDVFGLKNIKAIVVKNKHYFNSCVHSYGEFKVTSKELSRLIIRHPICGNALPNLGSQTLLRLMEEETIDFDNITRKENSSFNDNINRTCSPLCVIGCLNRHAESEDGIYSAPLESEVMEALENSFGIIDPAYAKKFTKACFDLGIDCMEFLFSCEMYFKFMNVKASIDTLNEAIMNVENMTLEGRILGSTTSGIHSLFRDKRKSEDMVSKPSIVEEYKFDIDILSKTDDIKNFSDLEYLYAYIILLENFGFCLFTSFAFLESKEALDLLAKLYYYKTGKETDGTTLLKESLAIVKDEKKIPNFVKVLYRYFDTKS